MPTEIQPSTATDTVISRPAKPRNVLFLMTDQHRVDTLGCYGNNVVHTPAIDSLARDGLVLDRCYTPTAICAPARASLLTGRYPFEHGLLTNYETNSGHRQDLPEGTWTASHALRENGFRLGHVGKWHVGQSRGPSDFGFIGEHLPGAFNPYTGDGYRQWLDEHGLPAFALTDPIHTIRPDGGRGHLVAGRLAQPTEATCERYLADQAISMLREFAADGGPSGDHVAGRRERDRFWLSCNFFGPHLPYLVPDEWFDRYDPTKVPLPASMAETFAGKPAVQRTYNAYWGADAFSPDQWRKLIAVYWGYVNMIDQEIGRILAAVDELGLRDDTAVLFAADHGEFTGAHRLNSKGPAMYEDIYRIPAIARVPGAAPARRSEFTTLIDFTATILDIADVPAEGCRGRSLLPLALGEECADWRDHVLCEFHGLHFSYAQRMFRDSHYKLVVNAEGIDELYDLERDPHELSNVVAVPAYAEVARDLRLRMYRELVQRGDRFAQWLAVMADIPEQDRVHPPLSPEDQFSGKARSHKLETKEAG